MILVLLASASWASGTYPDAVATELGMACVPTCNLCHESALGGGLAPQPFAMAMKANGLTGGSNTSALTTALDALAADGTDSDEDGTPDVDELAAGSNPNDDSAFCGEAAVPGPTYGCFNTAGVAPGALGVLVGLAALLRRGVRTAR
jgi:hypothetical protein